MDCSRAFATAEFQKIIGDFKGTIIKDAPMSAHTSWKIGGPADYLIAPQTVDELSAVLRFVKRNAVPLTIIGRGTNLLVADDGIAGVVLQISDNFSRIGWLNETEVRAEAGGLISVLSRETVRKGLTGLEWAVGIPGNIGGAVMMNAGAYGSHISHFITEVEVLDFTSGEPEARVMVPDEMDFSYRHSCLDGNQIVLAVNFLLQPGDRAASEQQMRELLQTRSKNQPLEYPSAGSVFKNPAGDHAGRLVEAAGCRGLTVGGAQVSEKHGNFIINIGGATAADVLTLITKVQEQVADRFGIRLETEVRPLGRFE